MSLLTRARSIKALDQEAQAVESYPGTYVPIEELQRWTGLGVSPEVALNFIAVYQCVRVLSNTFAMLPLKLYRRLADGGKEEAVDHPLYRTFHLLPNPDMTSYVWRKRAMQDLATWGNHFSEITRDPLGGASLWPIRPDRIEVKWGANGRKTYTYLSPVTGRKELKPGTVFHMQGQTSDGLVGSSPISELRRTLRHARSSEDYGRSVFDNGARPAVVLSHPATLSDPAIKRLGAQMDELRGSRNAGKTVVLEEGLTVTEVGFPPEDAQFLQTSLALHRLIYGAYGVPPHKVADLERATFSNIEHQSLEFIQDGIMPWLVNAEMEFTVQIIDPSDDVFAEFLVDGYLRGDAKSRAEAYAIRWQHGTLNPNEWRRKENENPIEGGDTYYVPVNYQPAVAAALPTPEDEPTLTVVKSAEVRCPNGHLLAELATPPYRFTCGKCKAVAAA